jgi:hypothetical protein
VDPLNWEEVGQRGEALSAVSGGRAENIPVEVLVLVTGSIFSAKIARKKY